MSTQQVPLLKDRILSTEQLQIAMSRYIKGTDNVNQKFCATDQQVLSALTTNLKFSFNCLEFHTQLLQNKLMTDTSNTLF